MARRGCRRRTSAKPSTLGVPPRADGAASARKPPQAFSGHLGERACRTTGAAPRFHFAKTIRSAAAPCSEYADTFALPTTARDLGAAPRAVGGAPGRPLVPTRLAAGLCRGAAALFGNRHAGRVHGSSRSVSTRGRGNINCIERRVHRRLGLPPRACCAGARIPVSRSVLLPPRLLSWRSQRRRRAARAGSGAPPERQPPRDRSGHRARSPGHTAGGTRATARQPSSPSTLAPPTSGACPACLAANLNRSGWKDLDSLQPHSGIPVGGST